MEVEQMLACLLAEIRTSGDKIKASLKETRADQKCMKEEMRAGQEFLKEEMLAKLNFHHERMMGRMDSARLNGGHGFGGKSRSSRVRDVA
jgi:hypothetical protein